MFGCIGPRWIAVNSSMYQHSSDVTVTRTWPASLTQLSAEKLPGRQGLKGEPGQPGRDVSAADLKKVVETLIEQAISSQTERSRGPAGRDGKRFDSSRAKG